MLKAISLEIEVLAKALEGYGRILVRQQGEIVTYK